MARWLVTLLLFQAVWNGVLGRKHFVNKRGLVELSGALTCSTNRLPLAYLAYGCYCGSGGSGWPKDETDWCCHRHDCCYDFAQQQGCYPKIDTYKWTCQNNTVICDAALDRCEKIICQCDKEVAQCWRFAPFNVGYISWPNYLCGERYPSCDYGN